VSLSDRLVFIGGTALTRGFFPDGRLSEDLDLVATGARREVVDEVERVMVRGVRREYPGLRWDPPLTAVGEIQSGVLVAADGSRVRVQLLDPVGLPAWPTERRVLQQRYADAPPAALVLPTVPAFAAAKTLAWLDRAAPRDLFDLWLLARAGAIDTVAADLYRRYGPTGAAPPANLLERLCPEVRWRRELGGQTRLTSTAAEARDVVVDAWNRVR
jgi:hypothetical protein